MKEIVERLQERRNIEVAKSILESAGYKVSKKIQESTGVRVNKSNDFFAPYEDLEVVNYSRDNEITHILSKRLDAALKLLKKSVDEHITKQIADLQRVIEGDLLKKFIPWAHDADDSELENILSTLEDILSISDPVEQYNAWYESTYQNCNPKFPPIMRIALIDTAMRLIDEGRYSLETIEDVKEFLPTAESEGLKFDEIVGLLYVVDGKSVVFKNTDSGGHFGYTKSAEDKYLS